MTPPLTIPADFATVAAEMSGSEAGARYGVVKQTALAWFRRMPADWQAHRTASVDSAERKAARQIAANAAAAAKCRRVWPDNMADLFVNAVSLRQLGEEMGVHRERITVWGRANPEVRVAREARLQSQKKAGMAAHPRRQSKPAAPSFAGMIPAAVDSLATRAADHLKRVTRIQPICDAGKVYGKVFNGLYVVGQRKMPVAEMIELAKSKGYDPDAWKRVA